MHAMRALSLMLPLILVACGGSTESDPVVADAGTTPPRVPKVHRASATSCETTRDPGSATAPPELMNKCTTDAECTSGKNGRCFGSFLSANVCTYDECFNDGECKAAVCDCRNGGSVGLINKCVIGNCRTDADCAGNYCSPSGTLLASGCTGPSAGSYGFFCHTAADECVDDGDCGDAITHCLFEPDVLHWKCIKVLCPR